MSAHAVQRFVLVALVFPAVVIAAAVVVQLMLLPSMPATVAVHWNAAGTADGFAPAWLPIVLTVVLGYGLPVLMALMSLRGLRGGDRGPTYRFMGAMSAAVSTLLAMMFTWSYALQAGTDGTTAVVGLWPVMIVSFAVAAVVGVVAWWVQPAQRRDPHTVAPAQPLHLAEGQKAVWVRTASLSAPGAITLAALSTVLVVIAIGAWFVSDSVTAAWILTAVAVVVVIVVAMNVAFHVRVDAAGLRVASIVGVPRFTVPIAKVQSAAAVEVSPMGEFGGWGLRKGLDGRFGVILRAGSAIEVVRTDGRRFVVTVDDAATGAALLETFVQRTDGAKR